MKGPDFDSVKEEIISWGEHWQIQRLIMDIEELQIVHEYITGLEQRPGESEQIRRELGRRFHRSDRQIRYILYEKYNAVQSV